MCKRINKRVKRKICSMSNNEKGSLRKERKDIQLSIRLCEKDFIELKRISPKNVSYAIQRLIRDNQVKLSA